MTNQFDTQSNNPINHTLLRGAWIIAGINFNILYRDDNGKLGESENFNSNCQLIIEPAFIDGDDNMELPEDTFLVNIRSGNEYLVQNVDQLYFAEPNDNIATVKITGTCDNFKMMSTVGGIDYYFSLSGDGDYYLSQNPSDAFSFQLLGRVPYNIDSDEQSPFIDLLPGEVQAFDEENFSGNTIILNSFNYTGDQNQFNDYINLNRVIGPNAKGDSALSGVKSWKLGPNTVGAWVTNYQAPGSVFSSSSAVNMYNVIPDGFISQICSKDEMEGNWILNTAQGNYIYFNEDNFLEDAGVTIDQNTMQSGNGICISPIGYDDLYSEIPLYRLSNGITLVKVSDNGQLVADSYYPGSGFKPTSEGTNFRFINEGPGKFSIQVADDNRWLVFINGILCAGESYDDRAIISKFARYTQMNLVDNSSLAFGVSPYSNLATGPLNSGEAILYSGKLSPDTWYSSGVLFNCDADDVSNVFALGVQSLQVGPDTTINITTDDGKSFTVTSDIPDLSQITNSNITKISFVKNEGAKRDEFQVSSKLINDFVVAGADPQDVWRVSAIVVDERNIPQANSEVFVSIDDTSGTNYQAWCNGVLVELSDSEQLLTTNQVGELVISLPATDLLAPVLKFRSSRMGDDSWAEVYPDQDLHEKIAALDGSELINGFPATTGQKAKPSPFTGLTDETAKEVANALAASAGLIGYSNGYGSLDGDDNNPQQQSVLELMHWKTRSATRSKLNTRRVTTANSCHKHFVLNFESQPGARFRSHTSGWNAFADFHSRVRAQSSGPVIYVSPTDFSWFKDIWNKAKSWVVSTYETVVEKLGDIKDTFVDGIMVAVHYVEDGLDKIGTFVLNLYDQVKEMLSAALEKLDSAKDKIVSFFSFVFNWDSIIQVQKQVLSTMDSGIDTLNSWIDVAEVKIIEAINSIIDTVSDSFNTYARELTGDVGNTLPEIGETSNNTVKPVDDNWLGTKCNDAQISNVDASPAPDSVKDAVLQFIDDFINLKPDGQAMTDVVKSVFQVMKGEIELLTGVKEILAALLRGLADFVQYLGQLATDAVHIVITLLKTIINAVVDLLKIPFISGPLNDLFKYIDDDQDLTPWNLVGLMVAIPIAVSSNISEYVSGKSLVLDEQANITQSQGYLRIGLSAIYAINTPFQVVLDQENISAAKTYQGTQQMPEISKIPSLCLLASTFASIGLRIAMLTESSMSDSAKILSISRVSVTAIGGCLNGLFLMIGAPPEFSSLASSFVGFIRLALSIAMTVESISDENISGGFANTADIFGSIPQSISFLRNPETLDSTSGISGAVLIGADLLSNAGACVVMLGAAVIDLKNS